jgi:NADH-quinone oxidoreductase subunit A
VCSGSEALAQDAGLQTLDSFFVRLLCREGLARIARAFGFRRLLGWCARIGGGQIPVALDDVDSRRQTGKTFRVPDSFHAFEPILLFGVVLLGFVITNLVIGQVIGPHRRTAVKDMPYESGMDPIDDARQPFDVKFSLVAILFLIFDVELLFLYPWAVSAYADEGGVPKSYRGDVFWVMIVFVVTLVIPYVYAWRKGVFRWR